MRGIIRVLECRGDEQGRGSGAKQTNKTTQITIASRVSLPKLACLQDDFRTNLLIVKLLLWV